LVLQKEVPVMDAFKHVLIPIDVTSGSPAALAFGGAMARAGKAQLSLLHVHSRPHSWDSLEGVNTGPLDADTRTGLLLTLDKLSEAWRDRVGGVNLVIREGEPGAEITAFAKSHGVDLVVLEAEGRRGIDRLVLGSVAERVLRSAQCSILAIHADQEPRSIPAGPLAEILCAVDLSPSSGATLDHALALGGTTGARVALLHVVDAWHWDDPLPIARVNDDEARRLLTESAHERLSELTAGHAKTGEIETVIVFGRPAAEIVRVARQRHAGAIVMGAHSQPSISRFFFGSTADAVLRRATGALLMVRARAELRAEAPEHRQAEV
jgi:nucleotide-binding universal stress UspA family protein